MDFFKFSVPLLLTFSLAVTLAQTLPEGADVALFECPPPKNVSQPQNETERLALERRAQYRAVLPAYFAATPAEPYDTVLMPVAGVRVAQISDTWGGARSEGRSHEGQDIFAPQDTPIYSGTEGYVYRIGENRLGGNTVVVVGGGGWRYYYAHLSGYAEDLREGQAVTPDTLLGYVGTTGNAAGTPPHLHLGVYTGEPETCDWDAINPLSLLRDR
ncbi:hypothetical protein BH24DEI2_BH24DEI2_06270 [soil metagenome]